MNAEFVAVHVAEMLCFGTNENMYFAIELQHNL